MPRFNVLQNATIVVLTKNGLSQHQIADQVGCSKTTVKKTQDKYQTTNSITDMAHSGHLRVTTERTDCHIVIFSKSDRFKQATVIRDIRDWSLTFERVCMYVHSVQYIHTSHVLMYTLHITYLRG